MAVVDIFPKISDDVFRKTIDFDFFQLADLLLQKTFLLLDLILAAHHLLLDCLDVGKGAFDHVSVAEIFTDGRAAFWTSLELSKKKENKILILA